MLVHLRSLESVICFVFRSEQVLDVELGQKGSLGYVLVSCCLTEIPPDCPLDLRYSTWKLGDAKGRFIRQKVLKLFVQLI